jgi:hypothetical protein
MRKARPSILRPIKDSVLREFNHRCAICGKERPQIHHIDENPANNDPLNLIPLCPNWAADVFSGDQTIKRLAQIHAASDD